MHPFRSFLRVFAAYCLLISMGSAVTWAAIQVVVQSGDASPDGNGTMSLLNAPSINNAGQLAFVTQLGGTSGGTADNLALVRRETNGGITMIARRGETFDGKPINTFFPASAYIDGDGTVGAVLALGPPTVLWHVFGDDGALTPMYTTAMPSPSGQSNTLLSVLNATVNDSGVAIYRAIFNGAQPEVGLYQRATNGTHSVRVLQGASAPRGGTISSTSGRPMLNESNQIGAILTVDTGTAMIKSAARIDGTTVHELARQGDLIADGITTIGQIRSSAGFVNSAGQVAFAADYTQPASRQGIFLADDNSTTLVAPGLLPGSGTSATNIQLVGISDAGRVAFTTEFLGGTDQPSGMYLTGSGTPTLVAFEDTATPIAGKFFRTFYSDAAVLSDSGQLAFFAELSDTANGVAAGKGLFFYDPASGLQQIARTGDALLGSAITNLYFNGSTNSTTTVSPDTSLSGLNNAGQVAFSFTLANGNDGMAIWSNLPGDHNRDGIVDAADYVVWRKTGGTQAGYDLWRANFGQPAGAGMGATGDLPAQAAVPEPASSVLVIIVAAGWCLRRRSAT